MKMQKNNSSNQTRPLFRNIFLKQNKKGYFFLMDAIFAVIILVIGFMIISSSSVRSSDKHLVSGVSENVVDILASVKIEDLCDGCICTNRKLKENCDNDLIINPEETLLDYLAERHRFNQDDLAADTFYNLTFDLFRHDLYGIELKIDNNQIYADPGKSTSKELISRKKIGFGYFERPSKGRVRFFGPYLIEVNLWEI